MVITIKFIKLFYKGSEKKIENEDRYHENGALLALTIFRLPLIVHDNGKCNFSIKCKKIALEAFWKNTVSAAVSSQGFKHTI